MDQNEHALSETVAHILIAFLVVLITLFIIAAMTGVLTKFLQKPAIIAVMADEYDTGSGTDIIRLYHKQGDAVNLNGSTQRKGVSEIEIYLSPASGAPVLVHNAVPMTTESWAAGDFLFLYPDKGSYGYAGTAPATAASLSAGTTYTVQIIDARTRVLLHSLTVTID